MPISMPAIDPATLQRRQEIVAALRRIVIETTGLADPVPVLQAVMAHPVLMQALRLDGVVCVVDAVNGAASLDAHEEAVRQAADMRKSCLWKI